MTVLFRSLSELQESSRCRGCSEEGRRPFDLTRAGSGISTCEVLTGPLKYQMQKGPCLQQRADAQNA
jgi:hypothetical protein